MDANDRDIVPGVFPKFDYSFNASASWNNFDIALFMYGSQGQKQYVNGWGMQPFNQGSVPTTDWFNSWTPQNHSTTLPLIYITGTGTVSSNLSTVSTYYLKDASFLRLKNLQLGYTFPKPLFKRLGVTNFRIAGTAENLLTISSYRGLDPEKAGNNNNIYPIIRSYSLAVQLGF